MPDRDEMLRLAAACEAASGPDLELDCKVWLAFASDDQRATYEAGLKIDTLEGLFRLSRMMDGRHVYTASLDAAMSLVPAGWTYCEIQVCRIGTDEPSTQVKISRLDAEEEERIVYANAATPALALTAACLRAHAAMGE